MRRKPLLPSLRMPALVPQHRSTLRMRITCPSSTLSPLTPAQAQAAPQAHPALRATRRKPLLQNLQMPALMPQHRLAPMTLTGNLTTKLTFHKLTPTSMTSTTLQRLPLALTQAAKPKVMLSLLLDLVPAAKEVLSLALEAALAADLAVALAAKVRDAHAPLKLTSMMMTMDWPRSMPTLKPKRDLWLT